MEPTAQTDLRGTILGVSHLWGSETTQLNVVEGMFRWTKKGVEWRPGQA
jgi:hypothetical protein